ncbi:GntR family transcriptional regulator [Alkalibacillus aidingensis]|uniref:GntR family transcriptional regulator n=1 Tax=Alkalibacillus aidingensis TaxID=2747607 RepID=UPI001CB70544|nr:GntR family transcriptional regulator [Alkalibacillus aidingensis]
MKPNTSIKTIQRQSLREQVYQQLKTAIIRLELSPGKRVRDQDLAEEFNVSRTPVREALRRLEDEGLVEASPGSFTRIAEIDLEEVKQATVVVASLHALATKLANVNLNEDDIETLELINLQLQRKLEKRDVIGAVECDDRFHEVFLKKSNNQEIVKALEPVEPKIRRLEFAKFNSVEGINSVSDHQDIIKACQKGNSHLVSDLVEKNWLSLFELLAQ